MNTIVTIERLKELYPNDILLLGMGYDNMLQLPYWKDVSKYKDYITSIYVSFRQLTPQELKKTTNFRLDRTNTNLRFETNIPSWNETQMINAVNGNFYIDAEFLSDVSSLEDAQEKMNILVKQQTSGQDKIRPRPITYNVELPTIIIVGQFDEDIENGPSKIPPTSSSMMRYYIWKYITEGETSENKEKILNIMFSNTPRTEKEEEAFLTTIENYKLGMSTWFSQPVDDDYDNKYNVLLRSFGSSIDDTLNGGRKTHKKRSNKKRSNKKRSNKKRSNKKRSNNTIKII